MSAPVSRPASRPGAKATASRRRLRIGLLAAIALLYAVSVPWYRATGDRVELVFGLPDWVAFALGCYVAVAVLNSIAWLISEVSDVRASDESDEADPGL